MNFTYTEPTIVNYDGDTSRDWFVFSRITYEGSTKQIVWKKGINRYKDRKQRTSRINALKAAIVGELKNGWNPVLKEVPKVSKTLTSHLDEILKLKKTSFKVKSHRNYTDILRHFKKWLDLNKLSNMLPERFSRSHSQAYADYLIKEKHYSGKTHNNNTGILKAMFSELESREIITVNPWLKLKHLKEDTGKNYPFTEEEKSKILPYIKDRFPNFHLACNFTYFAAIRRSELIELKVGDIDLERNTIVIHSKGAKGRKQQSITISKDLEKLIREYGVDSYDKNWYVFGRGACISEVKRIKPDYLSYQFRLIADKLGIDKSKGYYAFKHSGACALYMATKDIYLVSKHLRHSDTRTTEIYLRSMGLLVNEQIREADFRI